MNSVLKKHIQHMAHGYVGNQHPSKNWVGISLNGRSPLLPVLIVGVVRRVSLHVSLGAVSKCLVPRGGGYQAYVLLVLPTGDANVLKNQRHQQNLQEMATKRLKEVDSELN